MKKIKLLLIILWGCAMVFVACDDEDDSLVVCSCEGITTIQYTLTPMTGGDSIVLSYVDLDGEGGSEPTISTGVLEANQTYIGEMELLDGTGESVENITEDILQESDEFQFFFDASFVEINIAYDDQDINGNPLGLQSVVTTGAAGTGILTVALLHEPDKFADGVADGDITNAEGATEVEITFPVTIQ